MRDLFNNIHNIIEKYNIDKVLYEDEKFFSSREVEIIQIQYIIEYLAGLPSYETIALYGAGKYCEYIFEIIKSRYENIVCIIDQNIIIKRNGLPVVSLKDFKAYRKVDAVFITSWNYHKEVLCELEREKYQGEVIDLPAIIKKKFPLYERPIYEYHKARLTYQEINKLELSFLETEDIKEKYSILKKIIYALLVIKDFLYAEKYIIKMEKDFSDFGESKAYKRAIEEIKIILEACVKKKGKDVLFIHVIDALSDELVDQMDSLKKMGEGGVRIKGIIAQYPHTHYAMNTIFTGKSPFEIELTGEKIGWKDSDLLEYVLKEKFSINIASGNKHVMEESDEINDNSKTYPYITLTEALFEGLNLWNKKRNKNIIVIHSCGEIHSSFYRVGSKFPLINCKEMSKPEQFKKQFLSAVEYVDEEIEYYNYFFNLTDMPMIIMGDHGESIDSEINYFIGNKKDLTRGVWELLNPAMVMSGITNGGGLKSDKLISNTQVSTIILAIINKKEIPYENITSDIVNLEFLPGYNEQYCLKYMERGMWGIYEGFRGAVSKDEIYLISQTGKRVYSLSKEIGKNQVDEYGMSELEKVVKEIPFPYQIFKTEKYKIHMKLLRKYDSIAYEKLLEIIENSDYVSELD